MLMTKQLLAGNLHTLRPMLCGSMAVSWPARAIADLPEFQLL